MGVGAPICRCIFVFQLNYSNILHRFQVILQKSAKEARRVLRSKTLAEGEFTSPEHFNFLPESKKEVTTYVVTSFLERATRLACGVITPRHAQRATNAPLGRFLASLAPCSPLCPLEPKKRRFCAVQAFCAAKPCRRANSLRPSILISCRNPKKRSQLTL